MALQDDDDFEAESVDDRSVLGRTTMIINAFDGGQPSLMLSDLTRITGLPRSTVHRFAGQLVAIGWLERAGGGYRVGTRLFEIGSRAERLHRLRRAASPWMIKLHEASRMCIHLAILDGSEILYLDKIGAHSLDIPSRIGARMPSHCTALGRAMLAYAPDADVHRVIQTGLEPLTPQTASTPAAFRARLDDVRDTGVAVDLEEAVPGIMCVAAPIRGAGRALAAVSVTGDRAGYDLKRTTNAVRAAAGGIWTDLFGTAQQPRERPLRNPVPGPPQSAFTMDPWSMQIQAGEWL